MKNALFPNVNNDSCSLEGIKNQHIFCGNGTCHFLTVIGLIIGSSLKREQKGETKDNDLSRQATVIQGWFSSRKVVTLLHTELIITDGLSEVRIPLSEIESMKVLSPSKAVLVHKGKRIEIRLHGPRTEAYNFLTALLDRIVTANPTAQVDEMGAAPTASRLKFILGIVLLLISFFYGIWFFSMAKEIYYMDKTVMGYVTGDSRSPDKYVVITKKGGQEISRRQATQEDLNRDKLKGKVGMLLLLSILLLISLAGIIKGISMMKENWPLKQQRK
jgi:hypothetical protein